MVGSAGATVVRPGDGQTEAAHGLALARSVLVRLHPGLQHVRQLRHRARHPPLARHHRQENGHLARWEGREMLGQILFVFNHLCLHVCY